MLISRAKPAIDPTRIQVNLDSASSTRKEPKLDTYLSNKDFVGAITFIEFHRDATSGELDNDMLLWLGYAQFHLGEFQQAMKTYQKLQSLDPTNPDVNLYIGCCQFFLGSYPESLKSSQSCTPSKLQNRLIFHTAHKLGNEQLLMSHHQNLNDIIPDQLSLASIHYLRSHYQEALDIYKRILVENPTYLAVNVYISMCYYKLEYYDVAHSVLNTYIEEHPTSITAINVKACTYFRLYNGKSAELELNNLGLLTSHSCQFGTSLIAHNLCVFTGGVHDAISTFSPLIDVIPEARLNLTIYYLKSNNINSAFDLMKDVEPGTPNEYILKAIVYALMGQTNKSNEHLKVSQQYFQLVGASASECDTIPGRQSMVSCFFLLRQFDEVLTYLTSIKGYFYNDDSFNFDYAQTKTAVGEYKEAIELFGMIQSSFFRSTYAYLSQMSICCIFSFNLDIMTKQPLMAWELYLSLETCTDSFDLLQLIANEYYKTQQYFFAAKAFDVLEKMDPSPEYWEGKRGAVMGTFQQIGTGEETMDVLDELIVLLKESRSPEVEHILRVIRGYAREKRYPMR